MKMKWSVVALVALGLVAGLSAAVLVMFLRVDGTTATRTAPSETVNILVAAKALPGSKVIEKGDLTSKKLARQDAPAEHLDDSVQAMGKVLARPMVEGQPFTKDFFVAEGSGLQLATSVPEGMRIVSIELPESGGLEGLLFPGSLVDVIASFTQTGSDPVSKTLLQDIKVLAVEKQTIFTASSDKADGKEAQRQGRRRIVSLLVNAEQAQVLRLAMEHGTVSLAMRNPLDRKTIDSKTTTVRSLLKTDSSAVAVTNIAPWSARPPAVQPVAAPSAEKKTTRDVIIIRGSSRDKASFELEPAE